MSAFTTAVLIAALAAAAATFAYAIFASLCLARFRDDRLPQSGYRPAVTLLKPICGLDHGLYANLRSFCEQDYPEFQVVFGVRSAGDPAVPVVERLIADLPGRDLELVVDATLIGTNYKVSNLANMARAAKHEVLLWADSDMRVAPDYLSRVVAPLADPAVGAVTCLYKGTPQGGFASELAAMFINEWFLPSVLVSRALRPLRFCFGATMAVRRDVLEDIGGFQTLASHLADDYLLGARVTDLGYKVVLSPMVIENVVAESGLRSLFLHELRWARTVRSVEPLGYLFSFPTYTIPVTGIAAIAAGLASGSAVLGLGLVAAAIVLRLGLHSIVGRVLRAGQAGPFWLVPLRDILCFVVWIASFVGRRVQWRGTEFDLDTRGNLVLDELRRL